MRRVGRAAIFLACVLFSVGAAYNVIPDNPVLESAAAALACGTEGATCKAQKTREERTPIARTFGFTAGKRTVEVRCSRALVFAGEYRCVAQ